MGQRSAGSSKKKKENKGKSNAKADDNGERKLKTSKVLPGREPPSWTPIVSWLMLPTGMAAAAVAGNAQQQGWALAAIFGACFIFFATLALWASPADGKGVAISVLIGLLGATLVTVGMSLTVRLGTGQSADALGSTLFQPDDPLTSGEDFQLLATSTFLSAIGELLQS